MLIIIYYPYQCILCTIYIIFIDLILQVKNMKKETVPNRKDYKIKNKKK